MVQRGGRGRLRLGMAPASTDRTERLRQPARAPAPRPTRLRPNRLRAMTKLPTDLFASAKKSEPNNLSDDPMPRPRRASRRSR